MSEKSKKTVVFLIGLELAAGITFGVIKMFGQTDSPLREIIKAAAIFAVMLALCIPFARRFVMCVTRSPKKIFFYLPVCTGLLFMLTVYLPIDSYLTAASDFAFTAGILLGALLKRYFTVLLLLLAALVTVKGKILRYLTAMLSGVYACVYIQYLFMNKNLDMLDGSKSDPSGGAVFSAVNLLIWAAVITLFLVLYTKKAEAKNIIIFKLPLLLFGVQLVSAVIMLALAPADIWRLSGSGLTAKDQFKVGTQKNIIVIVWDAFDNDYIEELRKTDPGLINKFSDFTFYTNTCSVYDATNASMTQMFTGLDFDNTLTEDEFYEKAWGGKKAEEFYKRLHNSGYSVLYYNMPIKKYRYIKDKLDNTEEFDDARLKAYGKAFGRGDIARYFYLVSAYRALPQLAKGLADVNGFDMDRLRVNDTCIDAVYANTELEKHLPVQKNGDIEKALIMQHFEGTHDGDTPEHCLELSLKYIDALKGLGLYENSDIIFTADHGGHNSGVSATPLFMIKRAGESFSLPRFDDAPVYHTDIMATLLMCAGCYDPAADSALFGESIYAFDTATERERTWYDRAYDPDYPQTGNKITDTKNLKINVYNAYTYTGGSDVLKAMAESGRVTKVLPMREYIG